MRDVLILFLHLIVTVIRLARPGGLRSVVVESLLVKHQLRILNRGRKRAPNLRNTERFIAGVQGPPSSEDEDDDKCRIARHWNGNCSVDSRGVRASSAKEGGEAHADRYG